jgi:outer membrane protein OmpA-like peptidoglycan-associated protein
MIRCALSLAVAVLTIVVPANAETVSFVACPIAQDTGANTDVCFFADYRGRRFALLTPDDTGAPQLGHRVLVEGLVTDAAPRCGGLVLDGRVSVLPEISRECDTIAPFAGDPPPPLAPAAAERARRIEALVAETGPTPSLSLRPMEPLATTKRVAALGRSETILYAFDSDRSSGPDAALLVELAQLARDTPGARISVIGYRGATKLDDNVVLVERAGMARQRADKIANILYGLGAPAKSIAVQAIETPAPATGVDDWRRRRIEIAIQR